MDFKKRGAHKFQFIVSNTGPVIPEEKREDVFKPFLEVKDLTTGLVKALVFGLVIGTVSVSQGLGTSLGATGVGRATQRSVIISFLLILMLGYMITRVCYQ